MQTHKDLTQQVFTELLNLGIISMVDPDTKQPVSINHPTSQSTINEVANDAYSAIKDINTHRPIGSNCVDKN